MGFGVPLRKQCQAVEGQEWDQAMSSSSEKDEDMEKTPDSDSLLACCKLYKNRQTASVSFLMWQFAWERSLNQ